jgi:hypothetical protein
MAILHERSQWKIRYSIRRATYPVSLLVVKAVDVICPRQYIVAGLTEALDDWVVEGLIGHVDLQCVFNARVSHLGIESQPLVR